MIFRKLLARMRFGPSAKENLPRGDFAPHKATFVASSLTASAVAKSLSTYGCALIKGLFSPTQLAIFDERIAKNIARVESPPGFPLYFAGTDPTDAVQRAFVESGTGMFNPAKMQGMDCRSLASFVFGRLNDTGLDRDKSRSGDR